MSSDKNKIDVYLKGLGNLIYKYRKEKDFSLEELGLRIGIDRSAMYRIEKGQNITIATIIKLCLALGKKPKDLFETDFNFEVSELGGLIKSKKSPKRKPQSAKKKMIKKK